MPVTDEQVATLRALLAREFNNYERLNAQLDQAAAATGYTALIAGAFFEAVDRRFAENSTKADVVEFVGDTRSLSKELSEEIDPSIAERLILNALGGDSIADVDSTTVVRTQIVLLPVLIPEEYVDEPELDAFMAKARELGDYLMS